MIIIDNDSKVSRTPDTHMKLTPTDDSRGTAGTGVKLVINGVSVMFLYEDSGITIYENSLRRAADLDVVIRRDV